MKNKAYSLFVSFLIAFILPASLNAMDSRYLHTGRQERINCMVPRMAREHIIYEGDVYNKKSQKLVHQDLQYIQSRELKPKLTIKKAKGMLGEEKSREEVELSYIKDFPFDQGNYISIFTLFQRWNCEITSVFRNQSDNGLDDIFIAPNSKNQSNLPSFPPIFHEAKYSDKGTLKLNKNKASCDQLSHNWIGGHLVLVQNKASNLVSICSKSTTLLKMKLPSCNPCYGKIQKWVTWLNKQFNQGKYYRTASVLDKYGTIEFYLAENR